MDKVIQLAHGNGGKKTQALIHFISTQLEQKKLDKDNDSAYLTLPNRKIAFTTDSFTVQPLFFPGGDIGKLAVCGTVNDLITRGARPLYLSLSFIIEEGFALKPFTKILESIKKTCQTAGVNIVTGDTKVVPQGQLDQIFINTTGLGVVEKEPVPAADRAQPGDQIIINGPLGEHSITILAQREELALETNLKSDCAPLNLLTQPLQPYLADISVIRDITRGGLSAVLNEISQTSKVKITVEENELPQNSTVQAACDLLGYDPLHLANEGKLILICKPTQTEKILAQMRKSPYGENAKVIGKVQKGEGVFLKTKIGGNRPLETLETELLPRIC